MLESPAEIEALTARRLAGLLKAAVFAGTRRLSSMFKPLLTSEEMRRTLTELERKRKARFAKMDRTQIVVILKS
jgi:shikimate kinase